MKNETNTSDNQSRQPKSSFIKKLGASFIGRSSVALAAEYMATIEDAQKQGITRGISRLESGDETYTMELTQLHTDGELPVSETVAPNPSQVRVSVLHSLDDVTILVAKNASIPDEEGYMTSCYYTVELLPEGEVCVYPKDSRNAMITGSSLKSANSRGQDIAVGPDSFVATLSDFSAGDPYPSADDNLEIQSQVLLVRHALAAVESYELQ